MSSSVFPRLLPVVPRRLISTSARTTTTLASNFSKSRPITVTPVKISDSLAKFSTSVSSSSSNSKNQPRHQAHSQATPLQHQHEFTPSKSQSTNAATDSEQYQPSMLVERAVQQASEWAKLPQNDALVSKLADDSRAVEFVMKFTDWVMRPETSRVAASFLVRLVRDNEPPAFMSFIDRTLVNLGAITAPLWPSLVVNSARFRMRSIVSPFVGTVETIDFKKRNGDTQKNVNLLGEAVLGDQEALRRRQEAEQLLSRPGVQYVSVKVSGVTSQLNKWDFEGSLNRVIESLRPLFEQAMKSNPRVLINLDMEEYHDLEITIEAFVRLLSEEQFQDLDAGIVLQAYLPDALPALQRLVTWANEERPGHGQIKIRLVKGANLAMEKVDAVMHGWEQAPYPLKSDTDANYLQCMDWVFSPERLKRVRIGIASHNLFTLAYAKELATERGVGKRIGFENLTGMTPSHTPVLAEQGHGMLLYTPVCRHKDFDVAISYLFRRFEESSAEGNFLRSLPTLTPTSKSFQSEEMNFRSAFAKQHIVPIGPRRMQQRPALASHQTLKGVYDNFENEPDSDPVLPNVRGWAKSCMDKNNFREASETSWVNSVSEMDMKIQRARSAGKKWGEETTGTQRHEMLRRVADVIARRRGDFINTMVHEGYKTIAEADPEISEAVDFANYYGMIAEQELPDKFQSFGVAVVAAPWNFPSAIGAGGAFASLAAGNSVLLKPSPNTPRCLELIAECAWEAGIPKDVLQFVQCAENEVGKHLITEADAVILTGSTETAKLFRSWKKDMRLFAETSGKNSMVISPAADLDLAVADLVHSAFSNSGQKCSASSLAICIGDVYRSERFLRQLKDAVESLRVGASNDIATTMGPLIMAPDEKLLRALTTLEDGEEWLVKPRCIDEDSDGRLWTPGVRLHVKPGSWFHRTEVFGPVLGVMRADNLGEALDLQNGTMFGLTGGLHSLDIEEIEKWSEKVQVGNAYINRGTTGAIVRRQCFGGWKESVVGPGAKAGGPNYIQQFGIVHDDNERDATWLAHAIRSDEEEWEERFSKQHDMTALFCESNVFRYRPLDGIAVRATQNANSFELQRVKAAIQRCGVPIVTWSDARTESEEDFARRLLNLGVERVRVVGETEDGLRETASQGNIYVADAPVVADGRYELLHYLREQSVSRTRHRFGNLVTA